MAGRPHTLLLFGVALASCQGTASTSPGDAGPRDSALGFTVDAAPSTPVPGEFRYGINGGYPNSRWNDQDLAGLERRAGATSQRLSLPETHLAKWGWTIEVPDVKAYAALGMGTPVAFLGGPTREHSTAPATVADWEVAYYMPKNLHEPVVVDGAINPNNYWAAYVFQTVKTYGPWISIWEIWNEPDWVSNWQVTQEWKTRAPTKADLPRWNGSIFDYIRLLRVSREAARLADPKARIATGGLGYPNFLDALFRYTDEPTAGKVDANHPSTGKAYVDVLSFHYYPIYTAGNSEAGANGFVSAWKAMDAVAIAAGATLEGYECTETGAPHKAVGTYPGGDAYARNYLLKTMVLAQTIGIGGVHWYTLSDGAADADPYHYMGLYEPVGSLTSTAEAVPSSTGIAYATLTSLLRGLAFDAQGTAALALPPTLRGAAFAGAHRTLVLWAVPPTGSEEATASIPIPTTTGFTAYAWDHARTGAITTIPATDGVATLSLTGTPVVFVEN